MLHREFDTAKAKLQMEENTYVSVNISYLAN